MLENVVEFFKNLPEKHCAECGEKIEEQSECYANTCEKCNSLQPSVTDITALIAMLIAFNMRSFINYFNHRL